MRDTTIRALAAGTNMSFSTANDVITINGPGLTEYALKNGPTFTGTVTTPLLNVQDYLLTQASEVIMYKPLRCTQGLRTQAWELLGSQHTLSAQHLGGLVLCKANNQTIVVMTATDYAGGYFEIIVPGPTALTLPAGGGTFTGPAGSGSNQLTLQATPSPHYRLVSDGLAWRVTNMVGIQGSPGTNGINGTNGTNGVDGVSSTAQLTQLYQNFTLSGGGTLTIKNVSGSIRLRWDYRVTCYPVKAGASHTNYDITCPTNTTQGMLVDANADGILINDYNTLWYILPITQLTHFS